MIKNVKHFSTDKEMNEETPLLPDVSACENKLQTSKAGQCHNILTCFACVFFIPILFGSFSRAK